MNIKKIARLVLSISACLIASSFAFGDDTTINDNEATDPASQQSSNDESNAPSTETDTNDSSTEDASANNANNQDSAPIAKNPGDTTEKSPFGITVSASETTNGRTVCFNFPAKQ